MLKRIAEDYNIYFRRRGGGWVLFMMWRMRR
jgi:hypothetical protein